MLPVSPSPYGASPAPSGPPTKKMPVWAIVLIVVGVGGALLLGTLGALAMYGMRRFVAASKTAEAKSAVGAIARSARSAYERESIGGDGAAVSNVLCRSAVPVPATVPAGVKHQPAAAGADFDTGDDKTGWRCLRFSMNQPIYYQYHYNQGAGYLVPSLSPGADGFEVTARGDIDGNGETSLFSVTGRVTAGAVVVSPSLYIEDEFE